LVKITKVYSTFFSFNKFFHAFTCAHSEVDSLPYVGCAGHPRDRQNAFGVSVSDDLIFEHNIEVEELADGAIVHLLVIAHQISAKTQETFGDAETQVGVGLQILDDSVHPEFEFSVEPGDGLVVLLLALERLLEGVHNVVGVFGSRALELEPTLVFSGRFDSQNKPSLARAEHSLRGNGWTLH